MFKSKIRDVVTPQAEHQRLAGMLAYHWGNADFDRPPHFDSFVLGVALHDRGYGEYDNDPIGSVPAERWLTIQQQGMETRYGDAVTDLVVLHHIRRLLSYDNAANRRTLMAVADEQIAVSLSETDLTADDFAWMDRITNLCDSIAFDFGFEAPTQSTRQIHPRFGSTEAVTVQYTLEPGGVITVAPWPFRVESFGGFIVGYEASSYPDTLEPVLLPFRVQHK